VEIAADLTTEVDTLIVEVVVAEEGIPTEVAVVTTTIGVAQIEVALRIAVVVTKVMEDNQMASPTEELETLAITTDKTMATLTRNLTAAKTAIIKVTIQEAEAANVVAFSSEEDHGWAETPLIIIIINFIIA